MRALEAVRSALLRLSAVLAGGLLAALVTLDAVQVVLRYALGRGFAWGGEVAAILLITLTWVGAGHLWLARSHVAVDLFGLGGTWVRGAIDAGLVAGALALLPALASTVQGFGFIELPALGVPASIKYWPVAGGVAFLGVAAALDLALLRRAPA